MSNPPAMATPESVLVYRLRSANEPKSELEWYACRIIEEQEAKIADLTAQLAAWEKQKPVAWMREWYGDISDLGNMIIETDKSCLDEPLDRWQPLIAPLHRDLNPGLPGRIKR